MSPLHMKWDVLRDCLYKYSKRAQDRFFKYFFEAYYFARFGLSTKGRDYLLNKDDMNDEKRPKIESEINVLTRDAVEAVRSLARSPDNTMSPALTQRLLNDIESLVAY